MQKQVLFSRSEIVLLSFMTAINFCLFMDFMILMPLGPVLLKFFEISAQQFGLLVSSYTLAAGAIGIFSTFYIDQFQRRNVLIIAMVVFAFGNFQCALSNTFISLLASRFLTGASAGVVGTLLFTIVSDQIKIEKRATAIGILLSAFSFAALLGVPFCLFLSHRFNWQSPFYFIFGLSLVMTMLCFQFLNKEMESDRSTNLSPRQALEAFKSHWADKDRRLALLFMLLLILGHFTVIPFLFPSLISNVGLTESQLPILYFCIGLISILSSLWFGWASDRFGKKRVFLYSLLGSLIPIYVVTTLSPGPLPQIIILTSAFFAMMGGRMTPAMALISASSRSQNRASFLSLIGSIQQLGAAIAAGISGAIVIKTESGYLTHFPTVGMIAIFFSLSALVISRWIVPVEGSDR